jgi:hypothetical protein
MTISIDLASAVALSDTDIDLVRGGMKWDRNHKSKDVIDARGGQIQTPIGTFTLDVNGTISGFTPRT